MWKCSFSFSSVYLLCAPAAVGLAHVGWRLDLGDELEDDVGDADEADNGAGNDLEDIVGEKNGANEDVEDATANEGEKKGRVTGDLRRNLKLEQSGAKTENDHVGANNYALEVEVEELSNAAQDHDGRGGQVDEAKGVGELHFDGSAIADGVRNGHEFDVGCRDKWQKRRRRRRS